MGAVKVRLGNGWFGSVGGEDQAGGSAGTETAGGSGGDGRLGADRLLNVEQVAPVVLQELIADGAPVEAVPTVDS